MNYSSNGENKYYKKSNLYIFLRLALASWFSIATPHGLKQNQFGSKVRQNNTILLHLQPSTCTTYSHQLDSNYRCLVCEKPYTCAVLDTDIYEQHK